MVNERADQAALEHFQKNLSALARSQGELMDVSAEMLSGLTWLAGRDGALTAQDAAGSWVTGCSLPRRAAEAMLESMQSRRGAVCLVAPTHAAQVRGALARLDGSQAVLAIVPEATIAAFILAGDDFTADIHAGRLWLAVGDDWPKQLATILSQQEGLPLPSSFIRLPIVPEASAEQLMTAARVVFNDETARRANRLEMLRSASPHRPSDRRSAGPHILVVAPTRFRLWDDAGWLMQQAMAVPSSNATTFSSLDPDDPRQASPLALAAAAAKCDALLAANAYRSEMANLVAPRVAWLTWVTTPRIAPPVDDAPADRLLLAEESLHEPALAAGWSMDRIRLATWPEPADAPPPPIDAPLVLISDTHPIDEPPTPFELSSHHVLWVSIRDEIRRDPFCIGDNLPAYLDARMHQLGLDAPTVNTALFIDQLIAPGFVQGIAAILLNNGVPFRIHGSGWDALPPFANVCGGPVRTREHFEQIVAGAGALLHPSPLKGPHLCHAFGRPVVHGLQDGPAKLVAAARRALTSPRTAVLPSLSPLCPQRIAQLCPMP